MVEFLRDQVSLLLALPQQQCFLIKQCRAACPAFPSETEHNENNHQNQQAGQYCDNQILALICSIDGTKQFLALLHLQPANSGPNIVQQQLAIFGFNLGAGNKPQPISEAEAVHIFNTKQELEAAPKKRVSVDYEICD